jgi:hypothetical protein
MLGKDVGWVESNARCHNLVSVDVVGGPVQASEFASCKADLKKGLMSEYWCSWLNFYGSFSHTYQDLVVYWFADLSLHICLQFCIYFICDSVIVCDIYNLVAE